jgi:hypothetical protein
MTQRIYRILFLLFIAAGSIRLSAQTPSSDFGAWIVGSDLKETTLTEDGDDITVGFDKENEFEAFDDPDGVESFDLQSEIAWTAAAGANVRITENLFLAADLKFIPWSAVAEGDDESDSLDIDPLLLSFGMKVRF